MSDNPFAAVPAKRAPAYATNKDVVAVSSQTSLINVQAAALEITDDESNAAALEMLSRASKAVKQVEELRKKFVGPLNDQVKVINDYFRAMAAPAQEADRILREKTTTYRKAVQAAAERERDAAAKLVASDVAMALGVSEVTPVVAMPTKTIVTSGGSKTTFRKVHNFEIVDRSLVPAGFWIIDEKALGAAVRAGMNPIPGVRIWDEEEPVVR